MSTKTDVLVIGAGGAGARAAIEASKNEKLNVLLLNQGPIGKSGLTSMANGGMQWVSHPEDSAEDHFRDVVRIGCYLNEQNLVECLASEAPGTGSTSLSPGARRSSWRGTGSTSPIPGAAALPIREATTSRA